MAGFTGAARSRHSGCGSGRGLPREVARNTTEPLGALLRGYPRRAASAMASGGSPARRRSPYWSKLQATIPSPKQRTREGEAHRGLERVKLQRRIDGVELLPRRTALGTGAGRYGTPPGVWAARIDEWGSCEAGGEVSVTGAAPAVSNRAGAVSSPGVGSRRNSRRGEAPDRCRGFRRLHGSEAKQMWWLSRAGTRRHVVATAAGCSAPGRGKAAAAARV